MVRRDKAKPNGVSVRKGDRYCTACRFLVVPGEYLSQRGRCEDCKGKHGMPDPYCVFCGKTINRLGSKSHYGRCPDCVTKSDTNLNKSKPLISKEDDAWAEDEHPESPRQAASTTAGEVSHPETQTSREGKSTNDKGVLDEKFWGRYVGAVIMDGMMNPQVQAGAFEDNFWESYDISLAEVVGTFVPADNTKKAPLQMPQERNDTGTLDDTDHSPLG